MYTGGSTLAAPYNQTRIERRDDVLVYTSDPLDAPLEVVGQVIARLWVASSAVDTDFVVKLCDVAPYGVSVNVADGMLRASWLASLGGPEQLVAGEVYEIEVDLAATGHRFRAGHAVRLSVTSSGFPLWQRNMNTGGDPAFVARGVVARQTVLHDAARPSHVALPVRPN
jgi:putative CocE/NonD family hydrolase